MQYVTMLYMWHMWIYLFPIIDWIYIGIMWFFLWWPLIRSYRMKICGCLKPGIQEKTTVAYTMVNIIGDDETPYRLCTN